jgi:hypothetical protein
MAGIKTTISKANGYWLFMNHGMRVMKYSGPFRPFAAHYDHLWQALSAAEKQEWKDRAQSLKDSSVVYNQVYLGVEKALKKNQNTPAATQSLLKDRSRAIERMLEDLHLA